MTPDFTIDPEFRDWIIPLTAEEFSQLNQNLIEDGCRDPLVVWRQNGVAVLVDGHHRYTICKANNIPFRVEERQFSSREEAKNWIILNQLGRRNISPAQRAYLIGKIYRETKVTDTFKGNQYTGGGNNFPQQKTAERIAEQFNVSGRAEARLHIVCLPADPARDHVLIPRENAGRRIDDTEAHKGDYSTGSSPSGSRRITRTFFPAQVFGTNTRPLLPPLLTSFSTVS